MKYVKYAWLLLLICAFYITHARTIETLYGTLEVTEPVVLELIDSHGFNRLKEIRQYGIVHYVHTTKLPYTRYTHSLGVFALLRMYGASLTEQIAGLLHDASHTVFSHVGDHVAARMKQEVLDQNDDAYQDNQHVALLATTDIADILARHNIALTDIDHKHGDFPLLERDLPDICADRLEYNLYGGYIEDMLNEQEIKEILAALHYKDGQWYLDDITQAYKLSSVSIKLCQDIFAAPWNIGAYEHATTALLQAVKTGLITMHDIHYGTDETMFQLLNTSNDPIIRTALDKALRSKTLYERADKENYDVTYIGKFRGIDPLVQTADGLKRLTELDADFKTMFDAARALVQQRGYYR